MFELTKNEMNGHVHSVTVILSEIADDGSGFPMITASCVTMTELRCQVAEIINELRNLVDEANTTNLIGAGKYSPSDLHYEEVIGKHGDGEKEYRRGYRDGYYAATELVQAVGGVMEDFFFKELDIWKYIKLPEQVVPPRMSTHFRVEGDEYDRLYENGEKEE